MYILNEKDRNLADFNQTKASQEEWKWTTILSLGVLLHAHYTSNNMRAVFRNRAPFHKSNLGFVASPRNVAGKCVRFRKPAARHRQTERQRDRETERQRDRETERQKLHASKLRIQPQSCATISMAPLWKLSARKLTT